MKLHYETTVTQPEGIEMETIMAPRLIAEIRTLTGINGVNAAALEELLKDALHECYIAGYDAGYDAGFNPGYDAGYYVGHSESAV